MTRSLLDPIRSGRATAVCAVLLALCIQCGTGLAAGKPRAFADFPEGQPQRVDFDVDAENLQQLSERERRDQALDWMLLAALSSARLPQKALAEITHDLPAARYGYMRPLGNFEFGPTRSRYIGDGRVVALIPGDAPAEQKSEYLSSIFDEHRKNQAEAPRALEVFEYELDSSYSCVRLTRRAPIDGKSFLTAKYGYYESAIGSLDEFARFMSRIDAMVVARIDQDRLVLGGRAVKGRTYRGIRTEDVATIWQSESDIQRRITEFSARWKPEQTQFQLRWLGKLSTLQTPPPAFTQELKDLRQRMAKDWHARGIVNGSGFSLDPSYDYVALGAFLAKIKEPESIKEVIADFGQQWDEAERGLKQRQILPLLLLIDALNQKDDASANLLAAVLEAAERRHTFQAARYDGMLQGTEVGMVLFYTDLLAKLWALDYQRSTPQRDIADFHSLLEVSTSPVYDEEAAVLPSTRLWFGPQSKGFQIARDRSAVYFARNATRVYAASSNPLEPGQERPAAAWAEAFLSWWNDHYEEVARFEPEYERLNEIMKWSVVIGWLNGGEGSTAMGFLEQVKVDHSARLPEWVAKRPELRFSKWEAVGFFPAGSKGSTTEALPTLNSESYTRRGRTGSFSGGVSLADRQQIRDAISLPAQRNKLVSRSNLDYAAAESSPNTLKTIDGVRYELSGTGTVRVRVDDKAKLRTRDGEVGRTDFERSLSLQPRGLEVRSKVGGRDLGQLDIERQPGGFKVRWQSRDVDFAHSLAVKLSASDEPLAVLQREPDIEAILALPGDSEFAVRIRGLEHWLRLSPEAKPSVEIAQGWQARVADPETGKHNIQFAWQDNAQLVKQFERDGYIAAERNPDSNMILLRYMARGPPDAKSGEISLAGSATKALANASGNTVALRWGDVPSKLRADPMALQDELVKLGMPGGPGGPGGGIPRNFANAFDSGDPGRIGRLAAIDPRDTKKYRLQYIAQQRRAAVDLLSAGDPDAAIRELRRVQAVAGSEPEILLQLAQAEMVKGRVQRAARHFERIKLESDAARSRFLDEALHLTSEWKGKPEESEAMGIFATATHWGSALGRKRVPAGEVGVVFQNDAGPQLAFVSPKALKTQSVSDAQLLDGSLDGVPVYVQDAPRLVNEPDWSPPLPAPIQQITHNGWGKLVVAKRQDLATYQPHRIYTPEAGLVLKSPRESSLGRLPRGIGTTANVHRPGGDCQPSDKEPKTTCTGASSQYVLVVLATEANETTVRPVLNGECAVQ